METSGTSELLNRDLVLIHIKPQDLRQAWSVIEPLLQKACDETRGEIDMPTIIANLENWPILSIARDGAPMAVMVTCVTTRADGARTLECLVASGEDAREWPLVDDQFDAFAHALGCTRVRIPCARKGWLKRLGHWKMRGYVLERAI